MKTFAAIMRRRADSIPQAILRCAKTLIVSTDKSRWHKTAFEIPMWDERNRTIASLIPENSSVLDLGAGALLLGTYLKQGCTYQPCDVIQSTPEVLFCDFNSGVYPKIVKRYDYVVGSGLLEYIRNPETFLKTIRDYGDRFIITYNVRPESGSKLARLSKGWVNHFTEKQLDQLWKEANLVSKVLHSQFGTQMIFELRKVE